MKRILDEALPYLKKLTEGEWVAIGEAERIAVSNWLILFSMSWEFADVSTQVIPKNERERFRVEGLPTERWTIGIGRQDRYFDNVYKRTRGVGDPKVPIRPEDKRGMPLTLMSFGHLVGVSCYFPREIPNTDGWLVRHGFEPLLPSQMPIYGGKPKAMSGNAVGDRIESMSESLRWICLGFAGWFTAPRP
ncbi:MAG: hypothetical protein R3E18_02575 [Sphingomonadaceae bacterium]